MRASISRVASQRGFILAMLLGMVAVMGIFLMKAMPSVQAEVQRGAEEELIFRGEAIARGIRLYQQRTGGYPLKLEDLMKIRPPVLRKIYKDPFTVAGDWDLVTAVQAGSSGDKTGLPIVGVRSRSSIGYSFKIYKGKSMHSDWVFSAADDILGIPAGQPNVRGPQQGDTNPNRGGGPSTPNPKNR